LSSQVFTLKSDYNDDKDKPKKMGRPLKFQDPVAFDNMVDEFFNECETKQKKPTIERLAEYMGCWAECLNDYEDRPHFSRSVKKAKQRCLTWLVDHGLEARNPAMDIFLLKNNFSYKDKTEVETTVTVVNYADRLSAAEERKRLATGNIIDITPCQDEE